MAVRRKPKIKKSKSAETATKISITRVSRDLVAARREAIKQMYFELGPERSFKKLDPLVRQKFGGPSMSTIQGWSSSENWPLLAREYDAARRALVLRDAAALIDVEKMDLFDGLMIVAKQRLKMLVDSGAAVPNGPTEERATMQTIKMAIDEMKAMLDDKRKGPSSVTNVQNNTVVFGEGTSGSKAREALALLQKRVTILNADAVPADAEPTGSPLPERDDEVADEVVEDEPVIAAADADPPEPTPVEQQTALTQQVLADIDELGQLAARAGKSFATILEERRKAPRP